MGTIARRAAKRESTGCAPAGEHAAALLNFEFDDSVPVSPRRTACSGGSMPYSRAAVSSQRARDAHGVCCFPPCRTVCVQALPRRSGGCGHSGGVGWAGPGCILQPHPLQFATAVSNSPCTRTTLHATKCGLHWRWSRCRRWEAAALRVQGAGVWRVS